MATAAPPLGSIVYPSPELVECPFAFYQRLRDEAPVHRLPNGDYVVSRWEDVVYVDRHPELFSNFIGPLNPGFADAYGVREGTGTLSPWPLPFTDPPDHRLKRSLLAAFVSRARLREYEPLVRELCDALIDGFAARGACDFKAEFADHLPPRVMLRIFDVPRADEAMIRGWMSTSQGQGFRHASPEQRQRQLDAMGEARGYFERLILARHAEPGPDVLSELVQAKWERDGDLDLYYLVGEVTTLYQAAYHNTVYMLANTLLLLLQHPQELARVQADPGLLRSTIDESLRRESPVQWLQRIVRTDTELHGVRLPEGAVLLVLYGSANRDERRFDDPERFSVEREGVGKDQLAFGHGIHLCLGAPLARLEGQLALERLLARLPNLRLAPGEEPLHIETVNHRGPRTVHIEFDPS